MQTSARVFLKQIILSVRVYSLETPVVFVVTENPALPDAVREFFLNRTKRNVSVVWLTSVASALRRLEWTPPAMVIVDGAARVFPQDADTLATLQTTSPGTRVLLLAEAAVTS